MIDLIEEIKKRVFVIAEIGCNHNGDLGLAKKLVDVSVDCGVDAVKFQSFLPERMSVVQAPKAAYQIRATGTKESQFERLKRMSLDEHAQRDLKNYCLERHTTFFSSPFDHDNVRILQNLNIPFIKIPSGEITNHPLLRHVGSLGKPVILSTGMSNLGEVERAIHVLGEDIRNRMVLLHCLSAYPAIWEETNLRAIETLRHAFHLPVGFSDHTDGMDLALVAVGMGAVVIEKHITLDKEMDGGDHKASLEPQDFKEMVSKIRRLEMALGNGIKRCMPSEENVRDVARKSLVTTRRIMKGERLTADDLAAKRPGTGISPCFLERVIGARAKEDLPGDGMIKWSQIDP
ncbi:MAG: N-acetylneuraminate synthase [Deltaproteobacteria bacterium]|nr:N-acetylneuraminate synthase [Deltaproteobacteria bacterium]